MVKRAVDFFLLATVLKALPPKESYQKLGMYSK